MTLLAAFAAPLLLAQAAATPAPPTIESLSLEQASALRCSVAFAAAATREPNSALAPRGREFFVRTMARLMDDTGASREALAALAAGEARTHAARTPREVEAMMPACLLMLDAAGL